MTRNAIDMIYSKIVRVDEATKTVTFETHSVREMEEGDIFPVTVDTPALRFQEFFSNGKAQQPPGFAAFLHVLPENGGVAVLTRAGVDSFAIDSETHDVMVKFKEGGGAVVQLVPKPKGVTK